MWPLYRFGFWLRETGQALEKLGCQLQSNFAYREQRTLLLSFLSTSQEVCCVAILSHVVYGVESTCRVSSIATLSQHSS